MNNNVIMEEAAPSEKKFVIAIDGPAASGKGTLARRLAAHYNLAYLDTGSLYRAVGFEVFQLKGNPEEEQDAVAGVKALQKKITIAKSENPEGSLSILSLPVLREDHIAQHASKVACISAVRSALKDLQRDFAHNPGKTYKGAILDGRDIGTHICPDADLKLYVTADEMPRAERRMKELQSKGIAVKKGTVLADLRERDKRDFQRKEAPLKPAEDAVVIDTSKLSADEVFTMALDICHKQGL